MPPNTLLCLSVCPPACLSFPISFIVVTRHRQSLYDVARLHLKTPMDFWWNSNPFWYKAHIGSCKNYRQLILSRSCLEQLRGVSEGLPNKSVEGKVLVTFGGGSNVGRGKSSMWMLCQECSFQASMPWPPTISGQCWYMGALDEGLSCKQCF